MVQPTGELLQGIHGKASGGSHEMFHCQCPFGRLPTCETADTTGMYKILLTFRNGQKSDQDESVLVGSPNVGAYVSN